MSATGSTVPAATTRDVPLGRDTITDGQIVDMITHFGHHSHELVPDRERCRNRALGPCVPLVDVEIGAAYGHSLYAYEHVVSADIGHRDVDEVETRRALGLHEGLHQPITSSPRPTSTNAEMARSSCSVVCPALICVRMRAVSRGTTGYENAVT